MVVHCLQAESGLWPAQRMLPAVIGNRQMDALRE